MTDCFATALQSLPSYLQEMQPSLIDAVDWVLDQCGWCYCSNAEWKIIEQYWEQYVTQK